MSTAFVFPGQGSQSIGMMASLAAVSPVIQSTFAEATEVLGWDTWKLVSDGPLECLNQTDKTQPIMLIAGVATWRLWQEMNGKKNQPSYMAGHSLGEYTALVCADALDFSDGLLLVQERGVYMQDSVPVGIGAMAAILGLENEDVVKLCDVAAENQILQAVNFNSPGQVVIAGNKEAVERSLVLAKDAGAKRAILLPVSVPSHCDLMKPAAEKLKIRLSDVVISTPSIAIINNVDVSVNPDADRIKDTLVRQLYSPVRWVETIELLMTNGIDTIVECGPGKVLTGLNKRINRKLELYSIIDKASLDKVRESLIK